jgi:hypothetical protein
VGGIPPGKVLVCHVDNGGFTAAAIATSASDLEVFLDRKDYRPKTYYLVDTSDALKVSDLHRYIVDRR